jgi:hypothetical protein
MRLICSLYYNNIDPALIKNQASAMQALGHPVSQIEDTNKPHQQWMVEILDNLDENASVLFMDIDAVALSSEIIERAFKAAEQGHIFGAAQTANHLDKNFIYAGPMFLCFSKKTWNKLNYHLLDSKERFDAGGAFTYLAHQNNIPVEYIYPSFCFIPLWSIKGLFPFGVGTFYEGEMFHLFASRQNKGYGFLFESVCNSIIKGEKPDYLRLYKELNSVQSIIKLQFIRLKKNLRKLILRR